MMAVNKSAFAWALTPLQKYAQFSGRAPRAEFWWFTLFMLLAYVAIWFLVIGSVGGMAAAGAEPSAGMFGAMGAGMIFLLLFWLALIIPTIAVGVRRLHDTNRSGWWLGGFYALYAVYMAMSFGTVMSAGLNLAAAPEPNMGALGITMILALVMLVYTIVLLVFYCLPGTPGPNNYGPDPYGAHENLEGVFS
jgi:uncharacterized membrane protein YhaH (DUF805 family)